MPLLPLGAIARPAVVGAVAALTALAGCGPPPSAERVRPITLTEDEGTTRGDGTGARPVELPDPARAGDDEPARQEPAPQPEHDPEDDDDREPPSPPAADDDDDDDRGGVPGRDGNEGPGGDRDDRDEVDDDDTDEGDDDD